MANKRTLEVSVILSAIDKMTAPIHNAASKASAALSKLSAQTSRMAEAGFGVGRSAVAIGATMATAFAVPIKAAMEFETGMTGVRKVVDGLKDDKAFAAFSEQVISLGRELPIAYNEITEMVAASGRMGIAKEDLIGYTREVGKMAMAFDMAAGDVGERMGKITNIFGIATKDVGALGDAINALDDSSTAKGADIMDVLTRVGGTANLLGLSAKNTAALGTAMLDLGSTAETSATAINAFFSKLARAGSGDKKFQAAIRGLGFDPNSVQNAMATDAQGTIVKVMTALSKVDSKKVITVADALFGGEYFDDAAKLGAGIGKYLEAIKTVEEIDPATSKLKHLGSMQREYEARMKTSAAQMAIFKNSLTEIAITLGNTLLPAFNKALNAIKPYIEQFREWAKRNPELVSTIGKVIVAGAALTLTVGALGFVFGGALKVISGVSTAFSLLTTVAGGTMTALRGVAHGLIYNYKSGGILSKVLGKIIPLFTTFGGILRTVVAGAFTFLGGVIRSVTAIMWANPILAIIGAIAIAAYLIYDNWDAIVAYFKDLWGNVTDTFNAFLTWIDHVANGRWYEAGAGLANALWEGIKSIYTGMWSYVMAPINYALEAVGLKSVETPTLTMGGALAADKFLGTNTAGTLGRSQQLVNNSLGLPAATPVPKAGAGGGAMSNMLNFNPQITINGNPTPDQMKETQGFFDQYKNKMFREYEEMTRQKERKAY